MTVTMSGVVILSIIVPSVVVQYVIKLSVVAPLHGSVRKIKRRYLCPVESRRHGADAIADAVALAGDVLALDVGDVHEDGNAALKQKFGNTLPSVIHVYHRSIFPIFSPPGPTGGIRTLDLRIMRRVDYQDTILSPVLVDDATSRNSISQKLLICIPGTKQQWVMLV